MSATVEPQWLVICEACSLCRRLDSAEEATVMMLEHNAAGGCPADAGCIDKRRRIAFRYVGGVAS